MRQIFFRMFALSVAGTALLLAAGIFGPSETPANAEVFRHGTPGDLFYNYYVPPVGEGSVAAAMYPCPRPTPPLVDHTYIPSHLLLPADFLYHHHRHYTTKHSDAPRTRTSVHWR
jgi:hypothetical protein